jgi:uncharacterized ion transporter superfamily protein YfcC
VLARGVTVVMNNSQITDTVPQRPGGRRLGTSSAMFGALMFLVNIPLAFLVPSSSGHATLAMPVSLRPATSRGVSRAVVVTAYQSASGWMNLFTPTSAVVMGGLALRRWDTARTCASWPRCSPSCSWWSQRWSPWVPPCPDPGTTSQVAQERPVR